MSSFGRSNPVDALAFFDKNIISKISQLIIIRLVTRIKLTKENPTEVAKGI